MSVTNEKALTAFDKDGLPDVSGETLSSVVAKLKGGGIQYIDYIRDGVLLNQDQKNHLCYRIYVVVDSIPTAGSVVYPTMTVTLNISKRDLTSEEISASIPKRIL